MRSLSINLTMEMTQIRNQIVSSRLSGTAVIQRARCILLAQRLIKFVEISRIVDLSAKAVARWFRRFAESIEALRHVEEKGIRALLQRAVLDCLRDAPRSGAPKLFRPLK